MRQAVGSAFILNLVIIFITLMMLVFVGSISYSKAYKTKNRIINIIEDNKGYNESSISEIETFMADTGYQISLTSDCTKVAPNNESSLVYPTSSIKSGYRYCIFENRASNDNGVYYTVVTFMKFDFPVIGNYIEFPVKGETKILSKLWD